MKITTSPLLVKMIITVIFHHMILHVFIRAFVDEVIDRIAGAVTNQFSTIVLLSEIEKNNNNKNYLSIMNF